MKLVPVSISFLFIFQSLSINLFAQQSKYKDGRPSATKRILCNDEGIILRYGDGVDSCDIYGAREALINKEEDTYYLFYDGAGKDGWKACLAISQDLKSWTKKGPILQLGTPGSKDAKSAVAPWLIKERGIWHMFYFGSPNSEPPPGRIPSFPYFTLKAKSATLKGPWIKQYDVTPFTTKEKSFYSVTASPGFIVKSKNEYLQFFSGALIDSGGIKRTLGIARTKNLNGSWNIDENPIFSPFEQVENSSMYYQEKNKTWFLFTNHVGIDSSGTEYTDAVWVYWSTDLNHWNTKNKAIVLDSTNCTWSKGVIGMPTVIRIGNSLALLYDGYEGNDKGHMKRNIGLAKLKLPLEIPK